MPASRVPSAFCWPTVTGAPPLTLRAVCAGRSFTARLPDDLPLVLPLFFFAFMASLPQRVGSWCGAAPRGPPDRARGDRSAVAGSRQDETPAAGATGKAAWTGVGQRLGWPGAQARDASSNRSGAHQMLPQGPQLLPHPGMSPPGVLPHVLPKTGAAALANASLTWVVKRPPLTSCVSRGVRSFSARSLLPLCFFMAFLLGMRRWDTVSASATAPRACTERPTLDPTHRERSGRPVGEGPSPRAYRTACHASCPWLLLLAGDRALSATDQ